MVIRAVQMAAWQREGESGLTVHSDRGGRFIKGLIGILTRGRVNYRKYRTRNEARADLFDCLYRFRNPRIRRRVARRDGMFQR